MNVSLSSPAYTHPCPSAMELMKVPLELTKVPLLKSRVDTEDHKVQGMIGHVTDLQDEYGAMEAEVSEAARVASEAAGQVCGIIFHHHGCHGLLEYFHVDVMTFIHIRWIGCGGRWRT